MDETQKYIRYLQMELIVRELANFKAIKETTVSEEVYTMPGWPPRNVITTTRQCLFCNKISYIKGKPVEHLSDCVWRKSRLAMRLPVE